MSKHVKSEAVYKGVPLSPGLVVARVCLFNEHRHSNLPVYKVSGEGVAGEVARVERAVAIARERLEQLRLEVSEKIGEAESEIFVAHRMILEDPGLREKIVSFIHTRGLNAETAVAAALDEYEQRMLAISNEYIRERATDFGEIKRRILDVLSNMRPSVQCSGGDHCQRGKHRVIIADELTTSMTVEIDAEHVMGFVTERGGVNAHGAILARALGVPAVSGIPGIRSKIACGSEVLVNGTTGEVVLWPSESRIIELGSAGRERIRLPSAVEPVAGFKVMANVSVMADVKDALSVNAEGIGLYRTEIEVIAAGRMLTENELHQNYLRVADAMQGGGIIFRMFDMGSDKPLPGVELPREENPALGWRGARLLLGRKDLFVAQARALGRLSASHRVSVMYPMVVDVAQFLKLRETFVDAIAGLEHGEIRHGVMFEVPAACLQAVELMDVADFASVGTNDLLQYLFAVDRDNELVAYDYNPDRPVFWKLLGELVRAASSAGKELSICGELAADPVYIRKLIECGIKSVSVSPRRISTVRSLAQRVLHGEIDQLKA